MTSLLSAPWIEERVVSALLYHRHKTPQHRPSQLAQVVSISNQIDNVMVLSDGKHSIVTRYEQVNGSLQNGVIVLLKDWSITTVGALKGSNNNNNAICFKVVNVQVKGGQGMGTVGKPSPIEQAVEVRRVLESWKLTSSTSELLQHERPPMGSVAKLLQDPERHYRCLQQYDARLAHGIKTTSSRTAESVLLTVQNPSMKRPEDGASSSNIQPPGTPVSRKRPLPENNTTTPTTIESKKSHQQLSPYKRSDDEHSAPSDEDSNDDSKKMYIRNMLVADESIASNANEEETQDNAVQYPAIQQQQQDTSNNPTTEETDDDPHPLLKLWWKTTRQPAETMPRKQQPTEEGSLLNTWLAITTQNH